MISLIEHEPHGPVFHGPDIDAFAEEHQLPPETLAFFDALERKLAVSYAHGKSFLWQHAMTVANGGEMPSHEEVAARAKEIVTPDGTCYLLWDHPPFGKGDSVDMEYCIATLDKPEI